VCTVSQNFIIIHKSDTAPANPRKSSAVHDTHGQFSKLPKLSPAELSRMKAEKEAQELITRRRAEEAQRQQMLQRIGSGTPGQPHVRYSSYISHALIICTTLSRLKSGLLKRRHRGRGRGRSRLSPLNPITERELS
jgi:hypothetical protein